VGNADEGLVAGLMTLLVVVALEVVDVDDDDAPRQVLAEQARLELGEVAAVEAAGERVAAGHLLELLLEELAFGDVDEDAVVQDLAAVGVAHAIAAVDHRAHGAVGAA
jgi:hypothetical protein